MSAGTAKLRLLLDEGVPVAVAKVFEAAGHEVVPFEDAVTRGSADALVCAAAQANEAVLVAFDKDMRQRAKRFGIDGDRFKTLSLIYFQCPEPVAASRLQQALSLIEHEWNFSQKKKARRLYVAIGKQMIRTHR